MNDSHFRAHLRTLALLALLAALLGSALPARGVDEPQPAAEPATAATAGAESPAVADGGDPFPPPVQQTRLEATFDPDTRRIDGHEHLRWHNTSSVALTELQFHLYLNAFSSNQSTFMLGSGGEMRGSRFDDEGWGWIEVESMTLPDGTDLAAVEEFLQPQDANPYDRTVARYPLPEPLPAGGWIELDIDFTSQLPTPPFARTGTKDGYVLAGQWFPKIAVFEDAGDRGRAEPGWNADQFNPNSEFYADFGDFDVTLTLPERYRGKIGATGRQIDEQVADGQVTVRFRQRGVHDFAWTADPDFIVHTAHFDPQADVPEAFRRHWAELLGLSEQEVTLSPVDIDLYLQPDHADQAARYIDSAKVAIRGYGTRLGAYPYATLTLVDPPLGALGSGGMEYPTFITLGTHALLQLPPFRGVLAPEVVTVHEFGHQFFQGMIANNEFEESWIDEGINTYYENQVMADAYGPSSMSFLGISPNHLEEPAQRRPRRRRVPRSAGHAVVALHLRRQLRHQQLRPAGAGSRPAPAPARRRDVPPGDAHLLPDLALPPSEHRRLRGHHRRRQRRAAGLVLRPGAALDPQPRLRRLVADQPAPARAEGRLLARRRTLRAGARRRGRDGRGGGRGQRRRGRGGGRRRG